ncbi:MAG: hypothetical protein Q9168_006187 [Polycauliona sp. 1 TL-2023]
MNHQDIIRIFTQEVEQVRREKQQARGQEAGARPVDLSLTVQLKRKGIYEVPEDVVDVLKPDVAGLRDNLFQEFPKPLLSLPVLEVLDLGSNRIRHFPEDIGRFKKLKYFDMTKNSIKHVPAGIKDLNSLQVLKLGGNPLHPDIARIVDVKDSDSLHNVSPEHIATSRLKQYLKEEAALRESEGSSSEGPLETPRPLVRNGSHRFPLRTNGSGPESMSEARSPGFAKPPLPARSHYRVTSGQDNMMPKPSFRRPGLTPLFVGNERNRSNSESVLQVTQNNRSKRMGMVTKKNNDLQPVDENQQNRSSFHLRGQSHASALREWHGEEELDSSGSVVNHSRNRRRKPHPIHQRGSLASQVSNTRVLGSFRNKSIFGDTAKSLNASLSTFEQCTTSLIKSFSNTKPRQLKDAQHEAAFNLDALRHSINKLVRGERDTTRSTRDFRKQDAILLINACLSAVVLYMHLGNLILDRSAQVLAEGEPIHVRATILQALGCSVEACHTFSGHATPSKRSTITGKWSKEAKPPALSTRHILEDGPLRDQSLTPTRERPVTAKRIVKNGMTPPPPHLPSIKPFPTTQSAVPLFSNGRSRSNSRADQYPLHSSSDSTFPFSPMVTPALTPQSSGLFSVPGTPLNRSRSSSVAAGAHSAKIYPTGSNPYFEHDYGSQSQFDDVCNPLESTVIQSRKILPAVKEHFIRCLNNVQTESDRAIYEEWSKRVRTCSMASELSDAMLKQIHAVRFQNPHLRNEKSFWDLAKKFLHTIGDLLDDVRAGYKEGFFKQDIIHLVRPISGHSKKATRELFISPWASPQVGSSATMTSPASANGSSFGHSRGHGSSGSNSVATNDLVPSTPQYAALGPAAQATVPSTPLSGTLEKCFQKNFFDRADAYQQTMIHRR